MAPTSGFLSREEAKARLGASESIFRQLRLANVIGRHTEPSDRRPRYAAVEIETFLSDFESTIPTRASVQTSGDRVFLVDACRKVGTPLLTVKALIQNGKVPSSPIDPTMQGIAAIHVDIEEVRTAVAGELRDAVPKLEIRPRPVPKDTGHIYTKAGLRDVILASDLDLPEPLDRDKT